MNIHKNKLILCFMIYLVYLSNCSSIAVSRVTRETTMKSVASSTKTSTSRTTQSSTMATRPTPNDRWLALKHIKNIHIKNGVAFLRAFLAGKKSDQPRSTRQSYK